MVEYIIAIDVTRVRFPADAYLLLLARADAESEMQILKDASLEIDHRLMHMWGCASGLNCKSKFRFAILRSVVV